MDLPMTFPITVTFERSDAGRYRAVLPDAAIEADNLEDLMEDLKHRLATGAGEDIDEEDDDDAAFERDLEEILKENAELYRRLARQ